MEALPDLGHQPNPPVLWAFVLEPFAVAEDRDQRLVLAGRAGCRVLGGQGPRPAPTAPRATS